MEYRVAVTRHPECVLFKRQVKCQCEGWITTERLWCSDDQARDLHARLGEVIAEMDLDTAPAAGNEDE